jgi:hypothetical protein
MKLYTSKLNRINVFDTSGREKSTFSKDDWKFLKNLENFNI